MMTISAGIGQGQVHATPIQMANVAATIARNGVWKRPRLIAPDAAWASDTESGGAFANTQGLDRVSGEGYYRNAYDFDSARDLLLKPAGPDGGGTVALCAHDPLTGVDHRAVTVEAPADAILIVDSVFGFRPEYNEFWDFRIWIDVDPEVSLARGIERDTESEGGVEAATALHRDRYHAAMEIYLSEVDPTSLADVIVDNSDFTFPRLTWRSRDER